MEVQKNDGARDIRVSLLLNDSTLCVSVCVLRFGVFFFFFFKLYFLSIRCYDRTD